MKRIPVFLFSLILLVVNVGCGGGGNPIIVDLNGLQGIWDYTAVFNGTLHNESGDSVPYNDTISGTFVITSNTITDDGDPVVWDYDGSTLTIQSADSDSDFDPDCGNEFFTGNLELKIPVKEGATVASISGTGSLLITSQFCEDITGSVIITGNMSKK